MKIDKLSYNSIIEYNNEQYQIFSIFPISNEIENNIKYYIQLANIKDINKSINIELNAFEIETKIKIINL